VTPGTKYSFESSYSVRSRIGHNGRILHVNPGTKFVSSDTGQGGRFSQVTPGIAWSDSPALMSISGTSSKMTGHGGRGLQVTPRISSEFLSS